MLSFTATQQSRDVRIHTFSGRGCGQIFQIAEILAVTPAAVEIRNNQTLFM